MRNRHAGIKEKLIADLQNEELWSRRKRGKFNALYECGKVKGQILLIFSPQHYLSFQRLANIPCMKPYTNLF